jgi:hypothetical protein
MSYATLLKINRYGDVHKCKRYTNSHRGAFLVWDRMAKEYLGEHATHFIHDDMQPIWDLWKNELVPLHERVLMAATFDNVMVKSDNLATLIQDIERCGEFLAGHFYAQAQLIKSELLNSDDCLGVCWHQASATCSPWWIDGGDDDGRSYNIHVDSGHWFLFDELRVKNS